jgi:hypothetical protein
LITFLRDYVVDIGPMEEREWSELVDSESNGERAVRGYQYEELETRGDMTRREGQGDGEWHYRDISQGDVPLAEYNSTA